MNQFSPIKPDIQAHHCCTLDALTVDDDERWTQLSPQIHSQPLPQTVMYSHPSSIFTPVAQISVHSLTEDVENGALGSATYQLHAHDHPV